MRKSFYQILKNQKISNCLLQNKLNQIRNASNYGYDLHSDMLNSSNKISITEYDDSGYVIDNIYMKGSIIALPEICLLWKPKTLNEINKESLMIIPTLTPDIEILLVGCGARINHNFDHKLREYLKINGIVVELLNSSHACATFNILNAEDRNVAAVILPINA